MAESGTTSSKLNPETLILRGSPRKVVRLRRNLLVATAAIGCVTLFLVMGLALRSHPARSQQAQEPVNIDRKITADGLASLPSDYTGVKKAEAPALGPPLPGDLGKPTDGDSAEENDARAERMRLAQQARQAREAGVFFQLSQSQALPTAPAGGGNTATQVAAAVPTDSPDHLVLDPDKDQNNQQRKLDFVAKQSAQGIYNAYPLQDAASPYEVMAGSVISASLITGINSDLPGLVIAQVTENVYDTVSGQYLLIPQGARLIGSYDSVIAFGQSRALLIWKRIVMPDGSSIQIENLPATDSSGYAGLADKVDYHTWALLRGVVLSTMLGVGTQLSLGDNNPDLVRAIEESSELNADRAGQQITQKNLNIQPTITIRPGWPLRVIVHKDLLLRPWNTRSYDGSATMLAP